MTAIGAWSWDGMPVLFGDVALSGLDDKSVAQVPTVGAVSSRFPPGSGYVISGTCQKVLVLSVDLGIAWAGPRLAAEEAFGLLRSETRSLGSIASIEGVLRGLEDSQLSRELTLIGWVRESNLWRRFIFERMRLREAPGAEPVFAGTGEEILRNAHRFACDIKSSGRYDSRFARVAHCTTLAGYLMQYDVSSSGSLLNYFGGGYESATTQCDGLEKLEVGTHMLWDCEVVGRQIHIRPIRILRNFYQRGYLFVRTADIDCATGNRLNLANQYIHIIGSPGQSDFLKERFPIEVPSYQDGMLSSHAVVHSKEGPLGIINHLSRNSVLEDVRLATISVPNTVFMTMSQQIRDAAWSSTA